MSGKFIQYCSERGGFVADVYKVAGAVVVRAALVPCNPNTLDRRGTRKYDFKLIDFPKPGFWRPDLGVFVVPRNQLKKV